MEIIEIARIVLGAILILYSVNCWLNQRYWSRKHFDWRPKEHWPSVFWMNVIGSALIAAVIIFTTITEFEI
tara:strand:+ start:2237 stop:2449 length:213 start_codon:yes stop_codon:yes gene_type:complete